MRKLFTILISLLVAPAAVAVTTSHWTHTTEADFKAGTFHNVVATNLGDLKLSRAVKTLLGQNEKVSAVHALVQAPDGTIYAGTGPEGVLLAVKDGKVSEVATLGENTNILSLLIDDQGRLLVGTGGEKGQIFRIEKTGDKPTEFFTADGVQYIWSMRQTGDGTLYAATGPEGQLFQINGDGKHEVLFDAEEHNLLSMTGDGKDLLYVGTDPNGLIYRVNRKTKESFVLYDAGETEITSLVLDAKGNLYAATGEADEAPDSADTGEGGGAAEKVGRPEGETGGVPLPSEPPKAPEPPQPPPQNPGEPAPIPKAKAPGSASGREPKHLLILADPGDEPNPGGGDEPKPGAPNKPRKSPSKKSSNKSAANAAIANLNAATNVSKDETTGGNAIYKIDPDGFVTELFRQPVIIYALIEQNGLLLAGTGGDGFVYQINPTAEETAVIAKTDPKDVSTLLACKDGSIYLGLSNSGDIATMSSGFADEGTYTSPVLDATQVSRFGKIDLHGALPAGTALTIATRSANVDESNDAGWSKWSDESPAAEFVQVASPSARFLQYRLTFKSAENGKQTAVVDEVDVAYQTPNLAPQIKTVKVTGGPTKGDTEQNAANQQAQSGAAKADHHTRTITWEAADPNNDTMQYAVYFRAGRSDWILLKDKLTDMTYDWDTRGVADGRYEIRVVASDAAANPRGQAKTASRVSDPVVVDNTAPAIGDLKVTAKGADAQIVLRAVDRTSTIALVEYAVDSHDDWQTVLPSDTIADSPEEAYDFTVPGLKSGGHQIAVRATDAMGNTAFETVTVTIEGPTASLKQ